VRLHVGADVFATGCILFDLLSLSPTRTPLFYDAQKLYEDMRGSLNPDGVMKTRVDDRLRLRMRHDHLCHRMIAEAVQPHRDRISMTVLCAKCVSRVSQF
jgi:hypothetical protein